MNKGYKKGSVCHCRAFGGALIRDGVVFWEIERSCSFFEMSDGSNVLTDEYG